MVQRLNFIIAFLCPVLLTLLMKTCSWYHHAVIIIIMMLGMIVFFLFYIYTIFFMFFFSLTVSEVETVDVFSEHSIFENYFLYFSRVFSLAVGPGKDQFAWVCMLTQRKFESCSAAPPAPCSMHRVVVTLLRMRPRPTTRHEPFCRSRPTCRFLWDLSLASWLAKALAVNRGVFHRSSCSPRGDSLRLLAQLSWISPIAAKILWPPSCGKKFYRCAQRLVHVVALREWRNWPLLGRFRLPLFWREFFPPFGFKCCKNGCTDRKRSRENPVLFQKAPTVVEKAFPL